MFGLTWKLAVSNLVKNRTLYYPFALATLLSISMTYIFTSLTFNPHLESLKGAAPVKTSLALGLVIVVLASSVIVLYANSFVMKNRAKEMGIYGMLGLEKRHMISMVTKELTLFGLGTLTLGIGLGILLDKLVYALLLNLIHMKVELVSTFQLPVLIIVIVIFALVFAGLLLINAWRILAMDPLALSKESVAGEKKARFLKTQTVLGLGTLLFGYYLAQTVKNPVEAIFQFFGAVFLVVVGTYLLFNAGTTVFLQLLKKNKTYYYQPNNFISVSNLIFRMKKNAVGLATIAVLSTMVLVSLVVGVSLQAGGQHFVDTLTPADYNISGQNIERSDVQSLKDRFSQETGAKLAELHIYRYKVAALDGVSDNRLQLLASEGKPTTAPYGAMLVFNRHDYEAMTGKKLDLAEGQAAVYAGDSKLNGDRPLLIGDKEYDIQSFIPDNFVAGRMPNQYASLVKHLIYVVVNDENEIAVPKGAFNATEVFGFLNVDASDKEMDQYDQVLDRLAAEMTAAYPKGEGQYIKVDGRRLVAEGIYGLIGGVFFIAIFLSIIFLLGAVLVIYYKQISEGYEDRDRFVILQKVGLDEAQARATIRKQVLTVFFLPLVFAFMHLGFAYHMISLILQVLLGDLSRSLMAIVVAVTCGAFFLVYVAVFALTSRSYRRIVMI